MTFPKVLLRGSLLFIAWISVATPGLRPAHSSTIIPDHLQSLEKIDLFVHVRPMDPQRGLAPAAEEAVRALAVTRIEASGIMLEANAPSYMTIEIQLSPCRDEEAVAAALMISLSEEVELLRDPSARLTDGAVTWGTYDLIVSEKDEFHHDLLAAVEYWLDHFAAIVKLARKSPEA